MPLTRPAEISDGVSLSDKLGTLVSARGFVAEDRALDAFLLWDGVVDVLSPNKHGVGVSGSEHDVLAGTDELASAPSVSVSVAGVVALIEFKAGPVPVLRDVPERLAHASIGDVPFVVVNLMLIVPTQPVPSQNFQVVLDGQQVTINLVQTDYGLFMDVLLAGVPIITGQLCEDNEPMVQQPYLGFSGDLVWIDTMGTDAPVYTGLGMRWQLAYLEPMDLETST